MDYYRSIRHKVQTALSLSPGEWAIFLRAWFWLLQIDLTLRSQPYQRVQNYVDKKLSPRRQVISNEQTWEIIRRNQQLVILAARYHLYPMTCLRQAMSLKALLGAQGIATELCFGVRKTEEQFLAHAWLEYERQTIELSNDTGYEKLLKGLEKQA
jgi:hypothetical protein